MLSASVVGRRRTGAGLEQTGVDGVFSFENAHDLFFPLVAAAPVCSLDLMTNVAIAFPRSPTHLRRTPPYDLHLLSEGRFRLASAAVRAPSNATAPGGTTVADRGVLARRSELAGGHPPRVPGEYNHTLMTPPSPGPPVGSQTW